MLSQLQIFQLRICFYFSAARDRNYWWLYILGHDNSTSVSQKVSCSVNILEFTIS